MVAAEFWEQGDLERTVLDQQPIVSACNPITPLFSFSSFSFHKVQCCAHVLGSKENGLKIFII